MRNALRLPAYFLLFCILLGALLTAFALLELRVSHAAEPATAARALLTARLTPLLVERFPAAVLLALVLTLFPLYRRPGHRLLSYLLPMGAAFAVLAFGGTALRELPALGRAPPPAAAAYFVPRRFQEFGGAVLYLEKVEGSRLQGAVALEPPAGPPGSPRLAWLGASEVRLAGQRLGVRGGGRSLEAPARPAYAFLLAEEPGPLSWLTAGFAGDLRRLSRILEERWRASRPAYYLTCLALVFSFFMAGVFFRITRWPLANVLLAFLVLRGYLFLFGWLREGVAAGVAGAAGMPRLAGSLPEAILLLLGAVLLLVDLLFLPSHREGPVA